ncbi:MAG: SPASM domain-containing protein [Candidatus Riflebacteria bacterium]|nr:SPASM domain-containing protein [Candidatus Riflebacteria bacterium]
MKIALFVTQECNQKCIYCYGGESGSFGSGGRLSQDTAFRAVDWLMLQSKSEKKVGIVFFGGEPFLEFPLMKSIVPYARKRGEEFGKEIDFSITTNGSLLDDEKIAFLQDNRIYPTVSFDGPKEIQDRQRPLRNGEGSYDVTLVQLRKLLKAIPGTSCRATLLRDSDPSLVERSLQSIGFRTVYITPAARSLFSLNPQTHCLRDDMSWLRKKAETEAEEIVKCIRARDTSTLTLLKGTGTWGRKLCRFANEIMDRDKRYFPCGAGRYYVGISCSGDVYPCHRLVGTAGQKIGNIFEGELERGSFQTSMLETNQKCQNCLARYICAGGCYHDNLGANGNIFDPDPVICSLVKHIVELSANIASTITENEKTFLVDEKIFSRKICPFDLFEPE